MRWQHRVPLLLLAVVGLSLSAQDLGESGDTGFSWTWPLEEMTLLENYSGNGRFPTGRLGEPPLIHGMRLASEEGVVRTIGPGRPIYISGEQTGGVNAFPTPLGGVVGIRHPGGLRSIYGYLEPSPPYGADSARPVGYLNGSGAQIGRTLFLGLYDDRTGSSVNPRLLLPERSDRFRPVVAELRLYTDDRERLLWSSQEGERVVAEGTVTIVTFVYDRLGLSDRFTPYRVTVFANGAQAAERVWSARRSWEPVSRGEAVRRRVAAVEAPNVTLVDGENIIEVVAEDFRGNVEERIFRLIRRAPQ